MAKNRRPALKKRTKQSQCRVLVAQVDVLPDDVLQAIFDFFVNQDVDQASFHYMEQGPIQLAEPARKEIEAWQSLVHVCRRWRGVVFGSPRCLNLRLACSAKTPAREMLDVWPPLPLFIQDYGGYRTEYLNNIIAVLERSDRVCQVILKDVPSSHLETVLAAMQVPFPELTRVELHSKGETVPVIPDSFLGGSAPCLHFLSLDGIPFPGLPKLLLSATHLVDLDLLGIPHSGYISPEVMVTVLSTLTSLRSLWIKFQSPQSRPDWASRRPPPPTRSVFPALTYFGFKGVSEYLDDLVARIDTPLIRDLYITFFNQIVFDTPQFRQFISRTPNLKAPQRARVAFQVGVAKVNLLSQTSPYGGLNVKIPCRGLDWRVSSLEQVCTSCLPPLSALEDLYIFGSPFPQSNSKWQEDNIENTQNNTENIQWLELLHPFTAVKNLYLSEEIVQRIVPALQELVGGRVTEVLPALQNIFLESLQPSGPIQKAIGQFVAARQVASQPIGITRWENNLMWEEYNYMSTLQ